MGKNRTKKIIQGLSVGVVGIVALLLFFYKIGGIDKLNIKNQEKMLETINNGKDKVDTNQDEIDVSQIGVDENFFKSMNEKELLHYRILNAVDFFDTVEGELNEFDIFYGDTTKKYVIDKKNNRSLINEQTKDKNIDTIFNNGKCIELDNIEKKYRNVVSCDNEDKLANKNANLNEGIKDPTVNIKVSELYKLKPKQRYDFFGEILSRSTQLTNGVCKSILVESTLGTYMKDYDKWSIIGHETLIDRECTRIEGQRDCVDTRSKAEKYTALIDTKTGIVLKYEELDCNDKVVNGLETKYIKYDIKYDSQLFDIVTKDYTEKVFNGK